MYRYGGTYEDMSGLILIDAKKEAFAIIRKARNSITLISHIRSLYNKYRDDFKRGIFRRQIAYEI